MIQGLHAGIVPHREWPYQQWLQAADGRYYHRPHPHRSFIPDARFYSRVDRHLVELCSILHRHGLGTTPSCQGHFHGRGYFSRRWEGLQREAAEITDRGLWVKDSETSRQYVFREPDYRLPWDNFPSFYRDSTLHQGVGYVGIILPFFANELRERFATALHWPEGSITGEWESATVLGGHLYHLTVAANRLDHGRQWRKVTDRVRAALLDIPAEISNKQHSNP